MAQFYRIHIAVSPLGLAEVDKVLAAIRRAWVRPHWIHKDERNKVYFLQVAAECQLNHGESEVAFAQRMSVVIWKSIGRYVKVVVDTAADDMPADCFELNELDYRRLMRVS